MKTFFLKVWSNTSAGIFQKRTKTFKDLLNTAWNEFKDNIKAVKKPELERLTANVRC